MTSPCQPLVVDKLAITFDAPESIRESIRRGISEDVTQRFHATNYRHSGRVYLNESLSKERYRGSSLVVQTEPCTTGLRSCRVEWNPGKVPSDIVLIGLNNIFGVPYKLLVEQGVITTYHVSIDFDHVLVDDLGVYVPKMRVTRNCASNGISRYIGALAGAKCICVYDKVAEIKSHNGQRPRHLREEVPTHPRTRIEVRLKPYSRFSRLHALRNPFKNIRIFDLRLSGPGQENAFSVASRLALRLMRYEGFSAAIAQLPRKDRKKLVAQLKVSATCEWWDPETIWVEHEQWVRHLHNPLSQAEVPAGMTAK